jgi:hypothetical protein
LGIAVRIGLAALKNLRLLKKGFEFFLRTLWENSLGELFGAGTPSGAWLPLSLSLAQMVSKALANPVDTTT